MVTFSYDKTSFGTAECAVLGDQSCAITQAFRAQDVHPPAAFIWNDIENWINSMGTGLSPILSSTVVGQRRKLATGVEAIVRQTQREESFDGARRLNVSIAIVESLAIEFVTTSAT